MPTILALSGASYPPGKIALEGRSFVPALQGRALAPRKIFIEHEGNRAVRDGEWKLVGLSGKPWELYNLRSDPAEMRNLAASEPRRVETLTRAWNDWAQRCSVVKPTAPGNGSEPEPPAPRVANRALTIRCELVAEGRDGVILAQGGDQNGYALHLKDNKLIFSVRSASRLTAIEADAQLPKGRCTLVARLASNGAMTLQVNGKLVATGKAPALIAVQPLDGLTIGFDDRSAVGDYVPPFPLKGKVEHVKIETP